MALPNAPETNDRSMFRALGNEDEVNEDQHLLQQQSYAVDPRPGHVPVFTGQGEGGIKQSGGMTDKINEKLPGCQDSKMSEEEPEKKGLMEKIKEKLPGHKKEERELNAPGNMDRGLLGSCDKNDERKQDQHLQHQSSPVDPRAGHAPAYNGQGEGGNKQAGGMMDKIKEKLPGYQDGKVVKEEPEKEDRGLYGAYGKKDEEKQYQHVSHAVDPRPDHAPGYPGQGEGRNNRHGGMTDKINEKLPGFQDGKVAKEEPEKKDYGLFGAHGKKDEGKQYQHMQQQSPAADSNAADTKDRGLFGAFVKKDERKQEEHMQQQPYPVDPPAGHAPAYTGQGEGRNNHPSGRITKEEPEKKDTGFFGAYGKNDEEIQDQHMQQQSYPVDPRAGSVPAYTGQGEGRNNQPGGKMTMEEPERMGMVESNAPERKDHSLFGTFEKRDDGKQEQRIQQKQHQQSHPVDPRTGHAPEKQYQHMEQQSYPVDQRVGYAPAYTGQGEGRNKQPGSKITKEEPEKKGMMESYALDSKDQGVFATLGKKDVGKLEELMEQKHQQQQSYSVDPPTGHGPAYTGQGEGRNYQPSGKMTEKIDEKLPWCQDGEVSKEKPQKKGIMEVKEKFPGYNEGEMEL